MNANLHTKWYVNFKTFKKEVEKKNSSERENIIDSLRSDSNLGPIIDDPSASRALSCFSRFDGAVTRGWKIGLVCK